MKKIMQTLLGALLLFNIGYLIFADYDGYTPYVTLFVVFTSLGFFADEEETAKVKKAKKNISPKTKDKDIPQKKVIITSYMEFKKELLLYKKTYANTPPILKVYIHEKTMDEIKQDFKEGYFDNDATFESILESYDPIEFNLMDFEVFIKTKYFKENSLYPTKSKLLKVDEDTANKEIRFWYNAQFSETIKDIDSPGIREALLYEAKEKLDDVDIEYLA